MLICFSFFTRQWWFFHFQQSSELCEIVLRHFPDNEVWGVTTFMPVFIFAHKFTHFPLSFWATMRSQAYVWDCMYLYLFSTNSEFRRLRTIWCLERGLDVTIRLWVLPINIYTGIQYTIHTYIHIRRILLTIMFTTDWTTRLYFKAMQNKGQIKVLVQNCGISDWLLRYQWLRAATVAYNRAALVLRNPIKPGLVENPPEKTYWTKLTHFQQNFKLREK